MSSDIKKRTGLEIMADILSVTREMAGSENADFIVDSIDRRERLMAEYDGLKAASPDSIERDRQKIDRVKAEIAQLDKEVLRTLNKLHSLVKDDLKTTNAQQKVMGYTNQAMSASGSYMDYKK